MESSPGLTDREREILKIAWGVMKHVHKPRVYLWFAEDGWEGGTEVYAEPYSDDQVAIRARPWETLILPPPSTTLN